MSLFESSPQQQQQQHSKLQMLQSSLSSPHMIAILRVWRYFNSILSRFGIGREDCVYVWAAYVLIESIEVCDIEHRTPHWSKYLIRTPRSGKMSCNGVVLIHRCHTTTSAPFQPRITRGRTAAGEKKSDLYFLEHNKFRSSMNVNIHWLTTWIWSWNLICNFFNGMLILKSSFLDPSSFSWGVVWYLSFCRGLKKLVNRRHVSDDVAEEKALSLSRAFFDNGESRKWSMRIKAERLLEDNQNSFWEDEIGVCVVNRWAARVWDSGCSSSPYSQFRHSRGAESSSWWSLISHIWVVRSQGESTWWLLHVPTIQHSKLGRWSHEAENRFMGFELENQARLKSSFVMMQ